MTTINDFIKELEKISPDKRELPLIMVTPNGMEVEPNIKMMWDKNLDMFNKKPDKMVITWED